MLLLLKLVAGVVAAVVLYAAYITQLWLEYADVEQCDRKCRLNKFGAKGMDNSSVSGKRADFTTCDCFENGKPIGQIPRLYDYHPAGYPYPSSNPKVCGLNGVEYPTPEHAKAAGVKVINCGPCGSCSTEHDVRLYRKYAKPMTKMLSKCALLYLFVSKELSRHCLRYLFDGGFTPACENRFMDNYGCTVSHCYKDCVRKWDNPLSNSINAKGASHTGKDDGTKLSPCMHCDEVFCSPVFINSGGANRRCSGTVTDVIRPGEEVCQHVNANVEPGTY